MINLENVNEILKSLLSANQKYSISRIMIDENVTPNYHQFNLNTPLICKNKQNFKKCNEFYKEILSSNKGKSEFTCPFGIKVKFGSLIASSQKITVTTQLLFDKKQISEPVINDYPRKSKKEIKKFLNEVKYLNSPSKALRNHDFLYGTLETLLYGRVALSMQGLTHLIFTPLQGALADYKNISENVDFEESKARLGKNLNAVNTIAQQIKILLSREITFSKNLLRKVNVRKMVEEIIEQLKSSAEDKFITFEHLKNNTNQKVVEAIPPDLNIVLSNILQNAVKYSFKGFEDAPFKIKIGYALKGTDIQIYIVNEGCGITEYEIKNKKLFELGYRGTFSTDKDRPGTGTGLHIAYQITKSHNGSIDIESTPTGKESENQRYINKITLNWPIYYEE